MKDYQFLSTWSKRSLVPIFGNRAQNQKNILPMLEDQAMSRKYIQENRDAINQLTLGIRAVDEK